MGSGAFTAILDAVWSSQEASGRLATVHPMCATISVIIMEAQCREEHLGVLDRLPQREFDLLVRSADGYVVQEWISRLRDELKDRFRWVSERHYLRPGIPMLTGLV